MEAVRIDQLSGGKQRAGHRRKQIAGILTLEVGSQRLVSTPLISRNWVGKRVIKRVISGSYLTILESKLKDPESSPLLFKPKWKLLPVFKKMQPGFRWI